MMLVEMWRERGKLMEFVEREGMALIGKNNSYSFFDD